MNCELYVIHDEIDYLQCGNCGCLLEDMADTCPNCSSRVIGVIDEGNPGENEIE